MLILRLKQNLPSCGFKNRSAHFLSYVHPYMPQEIFTSVVLSADVLMLLCVTDNTVIYNIKTTTLS